MTLTETFAKHTSQEFPPKYVFVYDENFEPKTIMVSEIQDFETMYKTSDYQLVEDSLTNLSNEWAIPAVNQT